MDRGRRERYESRTMYGNELGESTGTYYWGTGVERSDLGALSPIPVNFAPTGSSIVQISSG